MRSKNNKWVLGLLAIGMAANSSAQTIAADVVDGESVNLLSYDNPFTDAFGSAGDGFQIYQRGISPTIPFSLADDSISVFPADTLGIVNENDGAPFFGATDTANGDTNGDPVSATWVFDVSAGADLALSVDFAAMGDFENSDTFELTYQFDGGDVLTAFSVDVDEAVSQDYTLASGTVVTLADPAVLDGTQLNNVFQNFVADLDGAGAELTLTFTVDTDGGSEAFALRNIEIISGGVGADVVAFDLVGSASQNLTDFSNPFDGAFASGGDGFQTYQRGVSGSIPFSVLDDSLMTFPSDSLGIVDDTNLDSFFGATDTQNGDNNGPVSAVWTFDITGATELGLSIDMGAMGDFESSDTFTWTYSIDGGATQTAFSGSADEAISQDYTLAGGSVVTLNDPMTVDGALLSNVLTPVTTALQGEGVSLTLTLTLQTDGGSEAFAFQNIKVLRDFEDDVVVVTEAEIFEIQGDGLATPFANQVVLTRANVVTALGTDGFFMQTPADRSDANDDTSDGIYVFTGVAPTVFVGDIVDVEGTVQEFFGFTEFVADSLVTVTGSGAALPTPVALDATRPSPTPDVSTCAIEFECLEGMLVSIAAGTVTAPNQSFGSDPLAEVFVVARDERAFREPGIEFPGLGGDIPTWDGNPELFELDPDKLGLPNLAIAAGSKFSATGVIGFEFGGYELWPTVLDVDAANAVIPVRERAEREFTVGSLNMFRLFDSIDDPADSAADGRSRDDVVIDPVEYATRLDKLARYIVDVLDSPEVLAVQEVEKLGALDDLAAAINALDSSVNYSNELVEGNDVGTIDVGFMVRDSIAIDAVTQLGRDDILAFDGSLLNDRPPLLLEARYTGNDSNFPVAVISVHNRSLGGVDSASSGDRVRAKRLAQAQSLAAAVQALQTATPDINLIVLGDFNAFEFTDGFVDVVGQIQGVVDPTASLLSGDDLVDPDLTNLTTLIDPAERYSFIFRGSAQSLDHALISQNLDASLRGYTYGRGNADAPLTLIEEAGSPLRSSDHDGLVVYLTTDKDADGVSDSADACPGTVIPETTSSGILRPGRFALLDDDFTFDTPLGEIELADGPFPTTADTAGCSCNQIIAALGLGRGQQRFGCTRGAFRRWSRVISD